jgi:hypothetical protein
MNGYQGPTANIALRSVRIREVGLLTPPTSATVTGSARRRTVGAYATKLLVAHRAYST